MDDLSGTGGHWNGHPVCLRCAHTQTVIDHFLAHPPVRFQWHHQWHHAYARCVDCGVTQLRYYGEPYGRGVPCMIALPPDYRFGSGRPKDNPMHSMEVTVCYRCKFAFTGPDITVMGHYFCPRCGKPPTCTARLGNPPCIYYTGRDGVRRCQSCGKPDPRLS